MKKMKERIFVTHVLPGKALKELEKKYEVEVWPERDISREDLLKKVKGVVGIVSLLTEEIDKEVMDEAGESLKVIANYAVGYDNIDLKEATKRGIIVTNTPGVLTESVAEHAIALMMAVSKRLVEGDTFVREGRFKGWEPDLLVGMGLMGKTMGVIGLGRIGRWVARLSLGLGMEVVYYSRSRDEEFELANEVDYVSLERLLKKADVVNLSVPLTKETEGMIGRKELGLMKKTAILINTARGEVVDEKALIEKLKKREIAGAGLDVFEDETKIPEMLKKLPNVVLTPHIASATAEARLQMSDLLVAGLKKALIGKVPDNAVNREVKGEKEVKKDK